MDKNDIAIDYSQYIPRQEFTKHSIWSHCLNTFLKTIHMIEDNLCYGVSAGLGGDVKEIFLTFQVVHGVFFFFPDEVIN